MEKSSRTDDGLDGTDIQTAMLRHVRAHPDAKARPKFIVLNGHPVWASFELAVPESGLVRVEFLSSPRDDLQGVDIKAEGGQIQLRQGELIPVLRMWNDPRFGNAVEYPYNSKAGLLRVWNVYQRRWADGRITEEKWTGNAGMVVEEECQGRKWLFRCSDGPSVPPNFEQLIFRVSLVSEGQPGGQPNSMSGE